MCRPLIAFSVSTTSSAFVHAVILSPSIQYAGSERWFSIYRFEPLLPLRISFTKSESIRGNTTAGLARGRYVSSIQLINTFVNPFPTPTPATPLIHQPRIELEPEVIFTSESDLCCSI